MQLSAAAARISALVPSNSATAASSPLQPVQLSYSGMAGVLTLGDGEGQAVEHCSECSDEGSAASLAGDPSDDEGPGVRERVFRGGSVASVPRASRMEQEAPRGDGLVESGGLAPDVRVDSRFPCRCENRHVQV